MVRALRIRSRGGIVVIAAAVGLGLAIVVSSMRADDSPGPSAGSGEPAADWLLMVEENDEERGLEARRVDPETLEDLEDDAPFDLGHHYQHATSPDARYVAVMRSSRLLAVLEVDSWEYEEFDVEISDRASQLHYGENGSQVLWLEPADRTGAHGVPRFYQLKSFSLEDEELTTVAEFSETFSPSDSMVLPDGSFAVFGAPTDAQNRNAGDPVAHVVDVANRSIEHSVTLPGLKAGNVVNDDPDHDVESKTLRPSMAWDEREHLLYVVHPAGDRVTVVDLQAGEIREDSRITEQTTTWGRLVGWFTGTANAKMMVPTTTAYAALDPVGDYLYFSGTESDLSMDGDDQPEWDYRYSDLRRMTTDSLEEVARYSASGVGSFSVTPDGARVLARVNDSDDEDSWSLAVLDAEGLDERSQVPVGPGFTVAGHSPDGELAYVTHWNEDADEPEQVVQILDVERGEFIDELRIESQFAPRFIRPSQN